MGVRGWLGEGNGGSLEDMRGGRCSEGRLRVVGGHWEIGGGGGGWGLP